MTVHIYSSGLCYLSVCSDLTRAEIEEAVNLMHPTGIESEWRFSEDETFAGGEPNPAHVQTSLITSTT